MLNEENIIFKLNVLEHRNGKLIYHENFFLEKKNFKKKKKNIKCNDKLKTLPGQICLPSRVTEPRNGNWNLAKDLSNTRPVIHFHKGYVS